MCVSRNVNRNVRQNDFRFVLTDCDNVFYVLKYILTTMTYRTPTTLLPQAAPKKDSRLACRVDDDLKLRLGAVAKRHGRKESELMRHALEQLVTQLEAAEPPSRPTRKG